MPLFSSNWAHLTSAIGKLSVIGGALLVTDVLARDRDYAGR